MLPENRSSWRDHHRRLELNPWCKRMHAPGLFISRCLRRLSLSWSHSYLRSKHSRYPLSPGSQREDPFAIPTTQRRAVEYGEGAPFANFRVERGNTHQTNLNGHRGRQDFTGGELSNAYAYANVLIVCSFTPFSHQIKAQTRSSNGYRLTQVGQVFPPKRKER